MAITACGHYIERKITHGEGIKGCFAFCSEEDEKLLLWVSISHSHLSKN